MTGDRDDMRYGGFSHQEGAAEEVEPGSELDESASSISLASRGAILPVTTWDDDPQASASEQAYDRGASSARHLRRDSIRTGSLYPADGVYDYDEPRPAKDRARASTANEPGQSTNDAQRRPANPTEQRPTQLRVLAGGRDVPAAGSETARTGAVAEAAKTPNNDSSGRAGPGVARDPDLQAPEKRSPAPPPARRSEAHARGLQATVEHDTPPAPIIDTVDAKILRVLRDHEGDAAAPMLGVFAELDRQTRGRLAEGLESYRPGMGGELGEIGARFARLDPPVQRQLVAALASPAPTRSAGASTPSVADRRALEAVPDETAAGPIGSAPDAASVPAAAHVPDRGRANSDADARSSGLAAYAPDEESSSGGSSASAKPASPPAPPVDPESKYTYRRTREFQIHIGSIPAKIQFRLEASAKDKGDARTKVGKKGDIAWGVNQRLIEKSTEGTDLKISSAMMKADLDLLAGGQLPGPLAHLPPVKVEIKGLEGGLSLKEGAQLKLMTVAVYTQGDLSTLFPGNVQAIAELKGSIRIEWALAPDLAKKMIELARGADAIKRSAAVEAKIARSEKMLAYYRKRGVDDEVKRIERELSKLKRIRSGVSKARDAAVDKLVKISAELDKSAMGRLLKGASTKALGKVFQKFIPIYNVISTMQDLYEVGSWFASQDWGKIGDRIVNGGEGGTSMDGGDHDGDETVPGGGEGSGEGGPGDAMDVDPDVIERELQQEANPELHATAKAVMGLLEAKDGDGRSSTSITLLPEDKLTLNVVIPEDLTPAEIEAMKVKIVNAKASSQDLVESVIEAMQEVRPFGAQRLAGGTDAADASKQGGVGVTKPQRDEPTDVERREKATKPKPKDRIRPPRSRIPGTWIVDPADTLRKVITIDAKTRLAVVPDRVEFPGFTATVTVTKIAQLSFDTGGEGAESTFMVKVTIIPTYDAPGVIIRGGHRVQERVALPEIVVDGIQLQAAQRP